MNKIKNILTVLLIALAAIALNKIFALNAEQKATYCANNNVQYCNNLHYMD